MYLYLNRIQKRVYINMELCNLYLGLLNHQSTLKLKLMGYENLIISILQDSSSLVDLKFVGSPNK